MEKCKKSRTGLLVGVVVILIVLVAVYFGVAFKSDDKESTIDPTVTTKNGTLQGLWVNGAQGQGFKFAAFLGIPYADPPILNLRFKGPRHYSKKYGRIRTAIKEGSRCYQPDGGSEDCLYLNVYTPRVPANGEKAEFPVYVFIHGGVFQHGSGDMSKYGPDFLVQHGIVVVTMNYRLGVLAHLCLDTDEVPGNADLKDQVQVLRWVHENIEYFGGDPSKVTLGGQSSGGVSASWLTLLPATKGLIRAATTLSGGAMFSWGYTEQNVEFAREVYKQLTGGKSEDGKEIAEAVRSAKAVDLYYAAENATLILQATPALGNAISFFHLPCIERREQGDEEKLITRDPESYVIKNATDDIPVMLSETKEEWGIFFSSQEMARNNTLLEHVIHNLMTYVPKSIIPGKETQDILQISNESVKPNVNDVVKKIQNHYFFNYNCPTCNDTCKMAKYLNHVYIMTDTSHMMRLRSKYCSEPTYGIVFNLKSDYNVDISDLPDFLSSNVVHGDDLRYIFASADTKYDYYGNSIASIAQRRMVSMYANFIKERNPTPQKDDLIITEMWQPVEQGGLEKYLEVTENLIMHDGSMAGSDSTEIWNDIFSAFRYNKSQ